jgi:hypothetical protein
VGYYPSLREYVQTLESREQLFRIQREVCRETELHPLGALAIPRPPGKRAARVSIRESCGGK